MIEPNAYEGAAATPEASSQGDDSGSDADTSGNGQGANSPYQSLSIISPTPDQVFFGADAVVTVSADLQGTLRPDHQVVFFVNGNRKPAEGLSTELTGLDRGTYFLRASILDQNGDPVITSQQNAVPRPRSPRSIRPRVRRDAKPPHRQAHPEAHPETRRQLADVRMSGSRDGA